MRSTKRDAHSKWCFGTRFRGIPFLRPHVKTAKNLEVARLALGADTGPITVSTLREAEYFFDNGFKDILYAVGIAPAKLDRVIDLAGRGAQIAVVVDSVDAAKAVAG